MEFNGLTTVNVELTSRCNKSCWMCGRRKLEQQCPELAEYGDMNYGLVEKIADQLPDDIVVQLHNNGEPTVYPELGNAIQLFRRQLTQFDTNGKLLIEKADEIIDNLDVLTVSVIQGDDEKERKWQYYNVYKFIKKKGDKKPMVIARCLGNINPHPYADLGCIIARRVLHSPMGSFRYKKRPTIPEIGICNEALHHLSIDRYGKVSMCVRFDPKGEGVIGDATGTPLIEIWASKLRRQYIESHKEGKRSEIPLCKNCEYWGVPTGE